MLPGAMVAVLYRSKQLFFLIKVNVCFAGRKKILGKVNLVKVYVWVFIYFQNSPFNPYDIRVNIVLVKYFLLCCFTSFVLCRLVFIYIQACLKFMHSSIQFFSLQSTGTRDMCHHT